MKHTQNCKDKIRLYIYYYEVCLVVTCSVAFLLALAAVAVGRGAEASLITEVTCVLVLTWYLHFLKINVWKHKNQECGFNTRHFCVFKVSVRAYRLSFILLRIKCVAVFLLPFSIISTSREEWGVSSFSTGAQVLIWHSWYCTFAWGSVVLAKQNKWWAAAQLLCEMGSAHTKQSPVNLLLFLFPTKRNC